MKVFAKVLALLFLIPVLCISGIISCLSGLCAVLSLAAALISYDCILGVLVWGGVFIVSLPITLGTGSVVRACLSGALEEDMPAEIRTECCMKAAVPMTEKLQLRAPNGWQTGLIVSVVLFAIGLFWKLAI